MGPRFGPGFYFNNPKQFIHIIFGPSDNKILFQDVYVRTEMWSRKREIYDFNVENLRKKELLKRRNTRSKN